MEFFSTALVGIKVVEQSYEFIKKSITTAKDISELGSQIESFLDGHDDLQKKRFKKKSDPFALKNIAQEVIDAKIAHEKMQELSTLIDLRFGHGTWQSILQVRREKIRAEKERIKKLRIEKIRRRNEMMKTIEQFSIVLAVIFGLALLIFFGFSK